MATETPSKRLKTGISIGTHNGHFHADEALAVYMLRQLPAYRDASLIRTRDPKLLETCHTVVDVGGEYDPARNRYDHHQRGFDTVFPGRTTKLSSAGLVYMHFGSALIVQALAAARNISAAEVSESDADVALLYPKLYESFIEALDAHDNGIDVYDPAALEAAGITKRFSSGGFTLGAMVGRFNPNWNDPVPQDPAEAQAQEDALFVEASKRIGEEFSRALEYYAKAWLPARDVASTTFAARKEVDPLGRVMVFQGTSAPWKDHLYALEEEEAAATGQEAKVLYVLYPEKPVPGAKWRVQCVPESKDSFVSRKPLPAAWRGFRDEELDGITGIPGCVFVHASGFIGGNKGFEGAMEMVKKALE